jgi:hypothetical protein
MTIIDSQVHVYEANTPSRPWHSVPNWPDHVTGDEMVAAMDKVGVDGAIFISAFSMYQYDASYAVEVQQAHPGRFAIVKPVNPDEPSPNRVGGLPPEGCRCCTGDKNRLEFQRCCCSGARATGGRSPRADAMLYRKHLLSD